MANTQLIEMMLCRETGNSTEGHLTEQIKKHSKLNKWKIRMTFYIK